MFVFVIACFFDTLVMYSFELFFRRKHIFMWTCWGGFIGLGISRFFIIGWLVRSIVDLLLCLLAIYHIPWLRFAFCLLKIEYGFIGFFLLGLTIIFILICMLFIG